MTQEYIKELAQKFLEGTASEEEKRLLHNWYDQNNFESSENEVIRTAASESAEEVKERMQAKLKILQQQSKPRPFTLIRKLTAWSTAVAAATIIGFLIWNEKLHQPANAVSTVHAPLGKTLKVTLPDGSGIWLNAGSTVSYKNDFSGKLREVVLKEGQVFFDVRHDKERPFIVHTKKLDITVLGTSFDVKAYTNDDDIKVSVKTGKVGVTLLEKPERPALMLLPAEQAVLPQKATEIQVNEISKPAIAPWKDNKLIFEDELLSAVFRALERKYDQHIVVEKSDLSLEKISLTLDNQPLADVLKVLSFSKKFNYSQLNDSTIVIR